MNINDSILYILLSKNYFSFVFCFFFFIFMEVWGTRFLKCWLSASNKSVLKSTKKKMIQEKKQKAHDCKMAVFSLSIFLFFSLIFAVTFNYEQNKNSHREIESLNVMFSNTLGLSVLTSQMSPTDNCTDLQSIQLWQRDICAKHLKLFSKKRKILK